MPKEMNAEPRLTLLIPESHQGYVRVINWVVGNLMWIFFLGPIRGKEEEKVKTQKVSLSFVTLTAPCKISHHNSQSLSCNQRNFRQMHCDIIAKL